MTRHAVPDPTAPATAYSYLRFSTTEQRKGDSIRRQTADRHAWLARHPHVRLDTSAALPPDLGKSAFKGRRRPDDDGMAGLPGLDELVNPDRRALAGFLELIQRRKVRRGSYLIIENLDRLSRDDVVPATHLLLSILVAGVKVVQLSPRELVLTERSGMSDVMMAVIELSRGNSESVMKSERIGKAWAVKKAAVRQGAGQPSCRTTILTNRLPAWVTATNGRLELVADRAAVVRRIFRMAADGHGHVAIVKRLAAENVPAFGDRVPKVERDEGGNEVKRFEAKAGTPLGSGRWIRSYVALILRVCP